jgi:hypothetical protein
VLTSTPAFRADRHAPATGSEVEPSRLAESAGHRLRAGGAQQQVPPQLTSVARGGVGPGSSRAPAYYERAHSTVPGEAIAAAAAPAPTLAPAPAPVKPASRAREAERRPALAQPEIVAAADEARARALADVGSGCGRGGNARLRAARRIKKGPSSRSRAPDICCEGRALDSCHAAAAHPPPPPPLDRVRVRLRAGRAPTGRGRIEISFVGSATVHDFEGNAAPVRVAIERSLTGPGRASVGPRRR